MLDSVPPGPGPPGAAFVFEMPLPQPIEIFPVSGSVFSKSNSPASQAALLLLVLAALALVVLLPRGLMPADGSDQQERQRRARSAPP